MNNNCQHTDEEWRALQKRADDADRLWESIGEAQRLIGLARQAIKTAARELDECRRERAA